MTLAWTHWRLAELVRLRQQGKPVADCAAELGMPLDVVEARVRAVESWARNDVPPPAAPDRPSDRRRRAWPEERIATLADMRSRGMTTAEAAALLGTTKTAVKSIATRVWGSWS
jgi:hypothetical protein